MEEKEAEENHLIRWVISLSDALNLNSYPHDG